MSLVELQRAIGVSRVATITGLDRCGIEVACAIRPRGHVLQVSNGKGLRHADAVASALSEAAELWAAEQPEPQRWYLSDLAGLEGDVITPDDLGLEGHLWSPHTRAAWAQADDGTWVPAHAVWCLPPGSPSMGPSIARWSSNGMGAHHQRSLAVEHALCEALERSALPDAWSWPLVRSCRVRAAEPLVEQLHARGFTVGVFDLSAASPWPVAGAVLLDNEAGPIAVTAGYACRRDFEAAAMAAVLEAAQSRLTEVHGAREDVALTRARDSEHALWREWLATAVAKPHRPRRPKGPPRHAVIELCPGRLPLHVVKVLVPGARVSELLT